MLATGQTGSYHGYLLHTMYEASGSDKQMDKYRTCMPSDLWHA